MQLSFIANYKMNCSNRCWAVCENMSNCAVSCLKRVLARHCRPECSSEIRIYCLSIGSLHGMQHLETSPGHANNTLSEVHYHTFRRATLEVSTHLPSMRLEQNIELSLPKLDKIEKNQTKSSRNLPDCQFIFSNSRFVCIFVASMPATRRFTVKWLPQFISQTSDCIIDVIKPRIIGVSESDSASQNKYIEWCVFQNPLHSSYFVCIFAPLEFTLMHQRECIYNTYIFGSC